MQYNNIYNIPERRFLIKTSNVEKCITIVTTIYLSIDINAVIHFLDIKCPLKSLCCSLTLLNDTTLTKDITKNERERELPYITYELIFKLA